VSDIAKTREYRKEVSFWQRILGLRDCQITFEETDTAGVSQAGGGKVTVACYEADDLRRKAHIYFNRENPDQDGLPHTVAHEMVHVVGDKFIRLVERLVDLVPEGAARDLVYKQVCDEWEIVVDDIARAMLRLRGMGDKAKTGV
jgi:hypothetical protein